MELHISAIITQDLAVGMLNGKKFEVINDGNDSTTMLIPSIGEEDSFGQFAALALADYLHIAVQALAQAGIEDASLGAWDALSEEQADKYWNAFNLGE